MPRGYLLLPMWECQVEFACLLQTWHTRHSVPTQAHLLLLRRARHERAPAILHGVVRLWLLHAGIALLLRGRVPWPCCCCCINATAWLSTKSCSTCSTGVVVAVRLLC